MESNDRNTNTPQISNNPNMEIIDELTIKVKTIDSNEYMIKANPSTLINEVKTRIFDVIKNLK